MNTVQQSVYVDGQKKEVTEKEFELLKLLIENKNVTMKKEYLFNTVWGSDSVLLPQDIIFRCQYYFDKNTVC